MHAAKDFRKTRANSFLTRIKAAVSPAAHPVLLITMSIRIHSEYIGSIRVRVLKPTAESHGSINECGKYD